MKVNTLNADGTCTREEFTLDPATEAIIQGLRDVIEEKEATGELLGWCECEERNYDRDRYFDNRPNSPDYRGPDHEEPRAGGSHGWLCGDCGKVTQIG